MAAPDISMVFMFCIIHPSLIDWSVGLFHQSMKRRSILEMTIDITQRFWLSTKLLWFVGCNSVKITKLSRWFANEISYLYPLVLQCLQTGLLAFLVYLISAATGQWYIDSSILTKSVIMAKSLWGISVVHTHQQNRRTTLFSDCVNAYFKRSSPPTPSSKCTYSLKPLLLLYKNKIMPLQVEGLTGWIVDWRIFI